MRVTTSTRTIVEPDGTRKRIKTLSYHCAQCHQFVRSEDAGEGPSKGASGVITTVWNGRSGKPDPADVNRPDAPKIPDDSEGAELKPAED